MIVRYKEFGGYPLFGSSKYIKSMVNAISAIASVHYIEADHSWEGPLSEVLLYTLMYLSKFKTQSSCGTVLFLALATLSYTLFIIGI